jgi:BRCA1 C Terminus (BRCT) domain
MTSEHMFKNKVVCFSGRFDEFKRVDAELLVTAQGGSIVKQVTQSVDVFICGTRPGAEKLRNAHALGTSTMDEDEFLEGVGLADGDARLLRAGNVAGLASAGQAVAYPDPQYSPRMPTTREDIAAKHTSTFMQLAGSPFETVLSHQTLQTSFEL